jgi:hypothetical protein
VILFIYETKSSYWPTDLPWKGALTLPLDLSITPLCSTGLLCPSFYLKIFSSLRAASFCPCSAASLLSSSWILWFPSPCSLSLSSLKVYCLIDSPCLKSSYIPGTPEPRLLSSILRLLLRSLALCNSC